MTGTRRPHPPKSRSLRPRWVFAQRASSATRPASAPAAELAANARDRSRERDGHCQRRLSVGGQPGGTRIFLATSQRSGEGMGGSSASSTETGPQYAKIAARIMAERGLRFTIVPILHEESQDWPRKTVARRSRHGQRSLLTPAPTNVLGPFAQSTVTLYGIADAAVERASNGGGVSVTRLVSGRGNASRIGFRGVEDLGGGLRAIVNLEAGVNIDNGTGGRRVAA